jgi:hypothetical protein
METKHCKRCDTTKPLELFSKHPKGKLGLNTYCKACEVKRAQAYKKAMSPERREQLREYQAQYNKEYWVKNQEKLKADNRAWREMNYEQHVEYMNEYYKKNRDKFAEYQVEYKKANRGKVNSWVRMRNAQIKHRVFPEQKKAIAEFYDRCPKGYHVDHIVPINHPLVSGLHVLANLQYLTASENSSKRNRFVIE